MAAKLIKLDLVASEAETTHPLLVLLHTYMGWYIYQLWLVFLFGAFPHWMFRYCGERQELFALVLCRWMWFLWWSRFPCLIMSLRH